MMATGRPRGRALRRRPGLHWRRFLPLLVAVGVAACGRHGRESAATVRAATPLPPVRWRGIARAQRYVVRGWSGDQLLFELTTRDTLLALSPSLQQTLAAFDSAAVEVLGMGEQGLIGRQAVVLRSPGQRDGGGAGGGI